MKKTLNEISIMISNAINDANALKNELRGNQYKVSHKMFSEGKEVIEVISRDYEFELQFEKYKKLIARIVYLKALREKINANTKLLCGKTLAEAIAYLKESRRELGFVNDLSQLEYKKERNNDSRDSNGAYYEIREPRFNVDDMVAYREQLRKNIAEVEAEVQAINSKTEVEIID